MDILGRIKEFVDAEGISIYELSKRSGVPQSTLSTTFSRSHNPSIATLEQICNGLNITMAEFFTDDQLESLTFEEKALIQKWQKLSKEQKQALLTIIDLFN